MSKQLYRLTLDDCSMPGFCSFNTDYIGTLEDVSAFIESLRSDEKCVKTESRLIEAWDSYSAGNHEVTYNAAYQENKLLARVKCLGIVEHKLVEFEWEHLNTWDCIYNMKCEDAVSTHIWVSYQGKYRRCVRVKFTNLQYKNTIDEYVSFGGMCWGYPHMIEEDGDSTYHRMFVLEKTFKNKKEALLDMENFKKLPDIEFKYVLNDIFGDG